MVLNFSFFVILNPLQIQKSANKQDFLPNFEIAANFFTLFFGKGNSLTQSIRPKLPY